MVYHKRMGKEIFAAAPPTASVLLQVTAHTEEAARIFGEPALAVAATRP